MPKRTLVALSLIAFSLGASAAVTVTTGAGYVPMVEKLVEVCKNETAAPIEKSFGGNIGQMLAQVKSESGVNVVVTDRTTLLKLKTPVKFSTMQTLGVSPLMLVWRKGVTITNPEDLAKDGVKRIAHPDPKAAVYGRAGTEWVGASRELQIDIARGEWDFRGYFITDMAEGNGVLYMVYPDGIYNGTDLFLGNGSKTALAKWRDNDAFKTRVREAAHRVLYVNANFNCSMNGIASDSRIVKIMPWWQGTLIALIDDGSEDGYLRQIEEYERIFGFKPLIREFVPSGSIKVVSIDDDPSI